MMSETWVITVRDPEALRVFVAEGLCDGRVEACQVVASDHEQGVLRTDAKKLREQERVGGGFFKPLAP